MRAFEDCCTEAVAVTVAEEKIAALEARVALLSAQKGVRNVRAGSVPFNSAATRIILLANAALCAKIKGTGSRLVLPPLGQCGAVYLGEDRSLRHGEGGVTGVCGRVPRGTTQGTAQVEAWHTRGPA